MESSESAEYAKMFSDPPSTGAAVAASMYGEQEPATGIPVPMVKYQPKPRVPWSSNLCDCCSDVPNCCITLWCPCITFGQIAEIVDKGSNSCGVSGALYALIACVTFCPCCYSCFYRAKMRHQFTLEESPCGDCLVHCCCECCALCQEHRELKSRGFNMAIGWHGNMENQKRAVEMTPATPEQGMSR